jgi:peptidoglycan-associated lipoprotein
MKRYLMLAAAVVLAVTTGCSSKKPMDTMATSMDGNAGVTGVTSGSSMVIDDLDETLLEPTIVPVTEPAVSMTGQGASNAAAVVAARLQDIHFDFDRSVVRDGDKPKLLANASLLKANPGLSFSIEGHCDNRGTTAYNLALGERRAVATRRYLVALGVSPSQLSTVSYGEERGVCNDEREACWSQNRRSHINAR